MKTCKSCGELKELSEFSPKKAAKDGHHTYCKSCRNAKEVVWRERRNGGDIHRPTPSGKTQNEFVRESYQRHREKRLARSRAYQMAHKEEIAERKRNHHPVFMRQHRLRQYGLTQEQFDALLEVQQFSCAICHIPFSSAIPPHVDHSHSTGQVRGLLCRECNLILGLSKDDSQRLADASAYLAR